MRKAIITYKTNSWIRGIVEELEEKGMDFDFILAKNGDMEVKNKSKSVEGQYEIGIRFGTYANYLPHINYEYNQYQGIKDTSNKLKARRIFEQNNIPIPETYDKDGIVRAFENREINYPIIGREGNHYGGNNFNVYQTPRQLREGINNPDITYYSEFYPKQKEYRVHIASGKAIIVAEKVVAEENKSEYIWNLGHNGVCEDFKTLRWSEYRDIEHIIMTASLAVKSLKLDYGAVDVVANPSVRQDELPPCAVLEVNSAPRLEDYGISRYAQYFQWLLMNENNRAEYMLPHELSRYSFTNDDFNEEYARLDYQNNEREENSEERNNERIRIQTDNEFNDAGDDSNTYSFNTIVL